MRQRAGDRGRQRVARAVVMARVHPGRIEGVKGLAVKEQIGAVRRAAQVASLDQYPLRAEVVQGAGRVALGGGIDDVDAHQKSHLIEIGRDHTREWEQLRAQRVQCCRVKQCLAVHRGTDRVDDERHRAGQPEIAPALRDGIDDLCGGQHPGLGPLNSDIGDHRLDLTPDDIGRDLDNAVHSE